MKFIIGYWTSFGNFYFLENEEILDENLRRRSRRLEKSPGSLVIEKEGRGKFQTLKLRSELTKGMELHFLN